MTALCFKNLQILRQGFVKKIGKMGKSKKLFFCYWGLLWSSFLSHSRVLPLRLVEWLYGVAHRTWAFKAQLGFVNTVCFHTECCQSSLSSKYARLLGKYGELASSGYVSLAFQGSSWCGNMSAKIPQWPGQDELGAGKMLNVHY